MLQVNLLACGGETYEATQYYSPSAIYSITPISEEVARNFAKQRFYTNEVVLALPRAATNCDSETEVEPDNE
jgi:hypothetical protein